MLFDPGDAVFVEEPGYQWAKKLVQSAGLQARPIGIDEQGLDVGQLMQASGGGRGVYITPSHHYPLGYSLSLDRRLALLQWAQRQRARIIEDDYDAEFNYDRQTKAALQGLDSCGRTLYIGTFSKTLFPGLRIGFMIAPPQLVRPLVAARQFQDGYTSALAQMTLFHFLHEGSYAEHLRNMRTLYKARLDVLYDAVHRHWRLDAPGAAAGRAAAGLPVGGCGDGAAAGGGGGRAGNSAVRPGGLLHRHAAARALVLGFSAYTPDEIVRFIATLAQVFSALPVESDG